MEKRGVVKPGITPPGEEEKIAQSHPRAAEKESDLIKRLDNDFRLRAAETVVNTKRGKK